jgi:hypothetical protein
LDGTEIKTFNSILEASIQTNNNKTSISKACKSKSNIYNDFMWKFKQVEKVKEEIKVKEKKIKKEKIDATDFVDIKDLEDYFKINKNGDIYSIYNKCLVKSQFTKINYMIVKLKDARYYVHELVAQHFIPNLFNYKYIKHKDNNKNNNNVENLTWIKDNPDKITNGKEIIQSTRWRNNKNIQVTIRCPKRNRYW